MSALNSNANFTRVAALPAGVTREKAISFLHNHDAILNCDGNLSKYEETPNPKTAPEPLPANLQSRAAGETKVYAISDHVKNVPGGIWKSDVESTGEYTNLENGLFVRAKSVLGIVMETEWMVKDGGNGGLEVAYESKMTCSKLLIGMIKGSFEKNLVEMMDKIVAKLKEDN